MKLRIVPFVLSAVATAVLLFGGWMLYKQFAVVSPFQKSIGQIEGVASAKEPTIDQDVVSVQVSLKPDANLKDVYESIAKEGKDAIGSRELKLDITNAAPDDQLEKVWSSVLFDVAEAMEKKNYSQIPNALQKATASNKEIQFATELDDNNVYITLKDGNSTKYVVLPRTPAMLEVSTNA
ncbi:hypothetical protein [Paenibacillus glycanilyticus]|uniref:Uncharacterized protein n=1 Tax=Paenibacillus glycanilyticus TaxID=126569 RepID=A0ABQ6GFV1_9BACL|nr:hypothetical protein [Paenibacillus glycanilyticus]GLX68935.1 hypothetical protein MU1_32800 [Paenibacillus glycanilyticus]